jgi:hypothetical protein
MAEDRHVRDIIDQQRAGMRKDFRFDGSRIVQSLLRRTDSLMADHRAPMLTVLGAGWDHFVRAALHRPHDFPTVEQLEMWPESLREHVSRVGNRAVMVPSRGRMVVLAPGMISTVEVREAADYLIKKGHETVDRGRALHRLAEAMDRDKRRH